LLSENPDLLLAASKADSTEELMSYAAKRIEEK